MASLAKSTEESTEEKKSTVVLNGRDLLSDKKLGRREVDKDNINSGILRCPCCNSRMLSGSGTLTERHGDKQTLWIPRPAKDPKDDTLTWDQDTHQWWWSVPDVDDFSNVGLSRLVVTPSGTELKIVLCSECQSGPYGYTTYDINKSKTCEKGGGDPIVWLCCELLKQVDASEANDKEDFKAPQGIDVNAIRGMIESGALTTQFNVTFDEQRLGMMLSDADFEEDGVQVVAFTEYEGERGVAEIAGDIKIGDKVIRVNNVSTAGLDYGGVLSMIIEASRPITLHFERKGAVTREQERQQMLFQTRVLHEEWDPKKATEKKM